MPFDAPPPPRMIPCRECGQPFYAARRDQDFHHPRCRKTYHARKQRWAGDLYDAVIAWRLDRVGGAMNAMGGLAARMIADEQARRKRVTDGWRAIDAGKS